MKILTSFALAALTLLLALMASAVLVAMGETPPGAAPGTDLSTSHPEASR